MATKRINALTLTATEADLVEGNHLVVDTPDGTKRLPADKLLNGTAQNALAGSAAPAFDPTKPNDEGGYAYYAGTNVVYEGKNYVFIVNHLSGAWNPAEVEQKPLSESIHTEGVGEAVAAWLDEHPEATTTIVDDSVTDSKLAPGIKFNRGTENSAFGYKILSSAVPLISQVVDANTIYEVRWDFDLEDESLELPSGVTLKFNGGSISNGEIVGTASKVVSDTNSVFKNVTISGTWSNDEVSSNLFDRSSYNNDTSMLRNLVVIGGGGRIIIENGNYSVSAGTNNDAVLLLSVKGTHLVNKGRLELQANALTNYAIVRINADNCIVEGGEYVGDVSTHTGSTGEWGHGITINGVKNIVVKNLVSSHCWGDGISVGYPDSDHLSSNVRIDNVECNYCRRLGLSVTGANYVDITNCRFIGNGTISGTSPKAGLDIEENADSVNNNIRIENCDFINNAGSGFFISKYAQNYPVSNKSISVINCRVLSDSSYVRGAVIANSCMVDNLDCGVLLFDLCNDAIVKNSKIRECIVLNSKNDNILFENCSISSTTRQHGYPGLVSVGDQSENSNIVFNKCLLDAETTDGIIRLSDVTRGTLTSVDAKLIDCFVKASNRVTCWGFGDAVGCHFSVGRLQLSDGAIKKSLSYIGCEILTQGDLIWLADDIDNSKTISFLGNRFYSNSTNAIDLLNLRSHTANVILNGNICNKTNSQYVGSTGNRPSSGIAIGQTYYDTSIGAYIVWNGSDWIRDDGFSATPARIGSASQYPTLETGNKFKRFPFFDYSKQKYAYWDGAKWRDANGFIANKIKGSTSERPTLDNTDDTIGFMFYDKTLKKVIVWNGTSWTNIDGTALA